ncbi:MAG TPA: histidine kinase, partial [Microscillaceae bacterium]|nr:histidine kinase [Microscillaceae bacterium]
GFQDQFGGPQNRKYMRRRFREFLLALSNRPVAEQKQLLQDEFYQWKATREQTDDVVVIGFQFD